MKLNPDCIRDLLLAIEDTTDYNTSFSLERDLPIPEALNNYNFDTLLYHIRQCDLAGLTIGTMYADAGDFIDIDDLSPKGHEFLENIRSDNMWNNTKAVATKVGSHSLNALTTIATGVLTQVINQQLGLSC